MIWLLLVAMPDWFLTAVTPLQDLCPNRLITKSEHKSS